LMTWPQRTRPQHRAPRSTAMAQDIREPGFNQGS
jgi:hypothetical protein